MFIEQANNVVKDGIIIQIQQLIGILKKKIFGILNNLINDKNNIQTI